MSQLEFVLAGTDVAAAGDEMAAALGGDPAFAVTRRSGTPVPDADRRSIDIVALATLVLSVPPGLLAVLDLVDRLKKRRKAQSLIETAKRVKAERQVDVYLLAADRTQRPVVDLDADQLLDLVAELDAASAREASGRK